MSIPSSSEIKGSSISVKLLSKFKSDSISVKLLSEVLSTGNTDGNTDDTESDLEGFKDNSKRFILLKGSEYCKRFILAKLSLKSSEYAEIKALVHYYYYYNN